MFNLLKVVMEVDTAHTLVACCRAVLARAPNCISSFAQGRLRTRTEFSLFCEGDVPHVP